MKTKPALPSILVRLLAVAVFLTSISASRMVDDFPDAIRAAPIIGTCQMFPQNNFWNTPVTGLPVHAMSTQWINSIGASTGFHMDFGSGEWDGGPIGIPFNIVAGNTITKSTVDFYYPDESDPGPYPIPANPLREWGSDHHILIVDTYDCTLYELYDASHDTSGWHAGSGAIWDLDSNALRPDGWTSADAAGLPILPGLARYEEVAAGVINHALRFTTNCTADYYIWPARHVAQSGSCANPPPFGARFRLKAGYDISGFSPQAQVILQAMKTYGIVLADNGSPWYVTGAPSEGWDNDVLHEMDVVTGSDFEAVDTSGMSSPTTFTDVPESYWAHDFIERLYNAGITGGCSASPLMYCPEATVTRAQMAIFILRGMHGSTYTPPPATGTVFADVPAGAFAAAWIEQLAAEGITGGCGGGNYCPNANVTRAQMAIFLLRGEHGSGYVPPAATGGVFGDVPAGSFAADWIEQLAREGVTSGCGGGNYCPNANVTRAEMAVFLVRAFSLP
ncbi:MAG: S-layer homology domain-containing protein [Chloroflexi bacterium]|nr:S-layer homology domain-containing protein [Chloroflexota bacterium]